MKVLPCPLFSDCPCAPKLTTACVCGQYGQSYYIAVSAVNAAGLTGTVKSQAITIQRESQNLAPGKVAAIVVTSVLGTGIAVAAFTIWITSRRYCRHCCNGRCRISSHLGVSGVHETQLPKVMWSALD